MKVEYTSKAGRTRTYNLVATATRFGCIPYCQLQSDDKALDFWVPKAQVRFESDDIQQLQTQDTSTTATTPDVKLRTVFGVKLYPHQITGVYHLLQPGHRYLSDDMGLGKTLQAIVAMDQLVYADAQEQKMSLVLVIAPASVVKNWQNEIADNSIFKDAYHVVSYGKIPDDAYDYVIVDEAHYIKSPKAQRTAKALKACTRSRKAILLSGTPMTRTAQDLFVPCQIAQNYNDLSTKSFMNFSFYYCNSHKDRYGYKFYGVKNADDLKATLGRFMLGRKKHEVLNLPDKIRTNISIDIDYKLAKASREAFAAIEGGSASSDLSNQFPGMRKDVGVAKTKAAIQYIKEKFEDTEEQAVIFACHKDVIEALKEGLDSWVCITGETSITDRQKAVERFQAGEVKYFIGNIIAAGTGITLTKASHCVFVEIDISPANNWQAEDRIHRIGQNHTCNYHYLLGSSSFDERIYKLVKSKEGAIDTVMGARR